METIETLDKRLHAVFPRSIRTFGGLHLALWRPHAARSRSGSAPIPLPLYAYRGHTHLARFHRFRTIVDFDQAGNDGTQTRVHTLFGQTVQLSGDRGRLAVVADDSNDERADDDDTPKRRKYGPHSRLRDEMETKENVVGSTLDDEERITFVPSPHSLLFTVCLHVITIDKFKLAVTTFHVARRDYLLDGGPPVRST